ncbi:DUF6503 family protein [Pseudotenacibaculum sp. MALMAid0570]|uniref:DUF6503 family protein n=1 Tax=Pseudotenacibaculum sp. MALMAid0570 TaxID=3143938 RepID=UPI0032DE86C8
MRYLILLLTVCLVSCTAKEKQFSGKELLEKSLQYHDPKEEWSTAKFTLSIREPRTKNPERFSIVSINNQDNSFMLSRAREGKMALYELDAEGKTIVLLDNQVVKDSSLIKHYFLEHNRVKRYQDFYVTLLGLPMSLTEKRLSKVGSSTQVIFNEKSAYKVPIQLKEPMFSDTWNLFFSTENFSLIGIEMIFPEDPMKGERLYFLDNFQIDSMTIPKIRHWYDLSGTLGGSDVIGKRLK